ncbi:MAG: hypothetical protein RL095_2529 [Verrucomicrobiota bacterium]|jgi:hypothetical protein
MKIDRREMILGSGMVLSGAVSCIGTPTPSPRLDKLPGGKLDLAPGARRWLGPRWWANRLQDWRQQGEWIECAPRKAFEPWRNAVELCTSVDQPAASFRVQLDLDLSGPGQEFQEGRFAGITLGHGHDLAWRQRPMVFEHRAGLGSGHFYGITGDGRFAFLDLEDRKTEAVLSPEDMERIDIASGPIRLILTLEDAGAHFRMHMRAEETAGRKRSFEVHFDKTDVHKLMGGYALTCHHGQTKKGGRNPGEHGIVTRFRPPVFSGVKTDSSLEQAFGPFALSQYTVNQGALKLSAQLLPLAPEESRPVRLEFRQGETWTEVARAEVGRPDLVALLRVELKAWGGGKSAIDFRLVTELPGIGDSCRHGRIAAEPLGEVSMAVLGCIIHRPWGAARDWQEDLYFPHADAVKRVAEREPDLVFFYGDQMYEGTPTYPDWVEPEEDYLYKWYYHAYAFGELLRNRPSVSITDDHDAFQGNIWGNGGGAAPGRNPNKGGFVGSGEFIKLVHRTTCAHLPDSPLPLQERGIPPYTSELNWGGVSFAILMDRFFKSGPLTLKLPQADGGRPDHYLDSSKLDPKGLDLPGLSLLGEAQEKFLLDWAGQWQGAELKAVLSQSPFGMYSTHHSGGLGYYWLDLDANGWPQTPRNRAVDLIRRARAVHIAGDQHLPTLVRYGVDKPGDAGFSFTAPATANAYPRAWAPKQARKDFVYRSDDKSMLGPQNDPFGNPMDMIACANPHDWGGSRKNRDEWSPGFGFVVFNPKEQTTRIECWPLSETACQGGQYPGWPLTVRPQDQDGRKPLGFVSVEAPGLSRPVVRVKSSSGELLWAQRFNESTVRVPLYSSDEHLVEIGDGEGEWSSRKVKL